MKNHPIGVFDSGIGGLSILSEVKKILPKEKYIFLADQANVPYGEKSEKELIKLVSKILDFFEKKKTKMVIAACNTATVYTIDALRKRYQTPIIGVVPVVKTLSQKTKNRKIGILSTPATSKSRYLNGLIKEFAKDLIIVNIGGNGLENLVEEGKIKNKEIQKILSEILKPLITAGVDCIGLGCTHYPFLRNQIQEIVGEAVAIFDSGEAVAKRAKAVLMENNILGDNMGEVLYYTTGDAVKFKKVAEKLLSTKLKKVSKIKI